MFRENAVDLSPEEYLRMRSEQPQAIKSVEILPPRLGVSKDFGKIRVKLDKPVYKVRL
jgi:hypothetical protein